MVYRYFNNWDGNGAEGPLKRAVASMKKGFFRDRTKAGKYAYWGCIYNY